MGRSFALAVLLVLAGCASAPDGSAGTSSAAATAANASDPGDPSAPIALSGTYRSRGDVTPEARVTVDVVDTRQADATQHLADLEAGGASCFFVAADTYRCTSVSKDVPEDSLEKIAANNSFVVTFGKTSAPPALVSQADSLTEWQINQSGSSDNGSFAFYRYLVLDGGLVKIVLPDGSNNGQGTELIVTSGTVLGKYASTTSSESRWRFFEDSALVVLR